MGEETDVFSPLPLGEGHGFQPSAESFESDVRKIGDVAALSPREREAETARTQESSAPTAIPPQPAEFPSARAIYAAQGTRPLPDVQTTRRRRRGPMPTDSRAPSQWTMPVWLAAPPTFLVSAGLLGFGLILSLHWTKDNLDAGLAARAALRTENDPPVPIDPTVPPETRWWKTTAGHMAHWASAIERSPEAADRAGEVRDALDSANRAAPLDREVRYALGQSIGMSRDVASLTLTGRTLKRAGKSEAAVRAYRRALELAAGTAMERLDPPTFDNDPTVRRYRLPHESLAAGVVRDMIDAGDWPFADWSRALPANAAVRIAAARVLRERASPDADRAMDLVLAPDVATPDRSAFAAEHHAAQAEALAFKDQKAEAARHYRVAVGLAGDDATRRRWRLGLAEILAPLGATKERDEMLEAAKGLDPNEEVTRKALDAQKFAGLR